jgi:hypothetical protein
MRGGVRPAAPRLVLAFGQRVLACDSVWRRAAARPSGEQHVVVDVVDHTSGRGYVIAREVVAELEQRLAARLGAERFAQRRELLEEVNVEIRA